MRLKGSPSNCCKRRVSTRLRVRREPGIYIDVSYQCSVVATLHVTESLRNENNRNGVDRDAGEHERDAVIGEEASRARSTDHRKELGEMVRAACDHAHRRCAGTNPRGKGSRPTVSVAVSKL